jgi:hypothetical protein
MVKWLLGDTLRAETLDWIILAPHDHQGCPLGDSMLFTNWTPQWRERANPLPED